MYQPPHFRQDDPGAKAALIRAFPLGLLITSGAQGVIANPIPFLFDEESGPCGTLRCHVARANAQWKEIGAGLDALVVFQGSDHYIRPGWYEMKRETHKVVPTWNYAVVQARGRARAIEDKAWLSQQIRGVTRMMEGGAPEPWSVDDAPETYVDAQIKGIVGIEIELVSLDGKWKVSQNRNEADRRGVVEGLTALGDERAGAMARLVQQQREGGL